MNKDLLLKLLLGDDHTKVDTAVPATWFHAMNESRDVLGFVEFVNPAFSYAWSYIPEHGSERMGRPIHLGEMLLKKIGNSELYLLTQDQYMKLLKDSEQLREHLND